MGFEDVLNSIIYGPAGAKKLKREERQRRGIDKASQDILEMAKGAGGLQGMVQEPTAIQLPERNIPPIDIQPQMGGLDVQGQIPGLTLPARTGTGTQEMPLQESGGFQTKIAQLAAAMGGDSLMELLTTQTAQPELTYQQKSDIDLAEAKGLATHRAGLPGAEGVTDIVSWANNEGKILNLRKGEMPPKGYFKAPKRTIRQSIGDSIDDAMPDELLAFEEEHGRKPTAVERRDIRQRVANDIKREGVQQATSKALGKTTIKALPELRTRAHKSSMSKKRIVKMQNLLTKGVTGKPGQFKKALAGWLEFFPKFQKERIEDYSNSQLFHLLGRLMTGPMRLDIVGPGPVTEYEQKLWNTMSAGGGAAEPAARELLQMYSDIADETVDYYNESRDAASKGNPNVSLQFQRIESPETAKTTGSKFDKFMR